MIDTPDALGRTPLAWGLEYGLSTAVELLEPIQTSFAELINPKGKAPRNATDPVSITPMRILQGNPTVSGQDIERGGKVLPFVVSKTTYIREEVEVMPALDLLIVASQPVGKGGEDRVAP